MSSLFQIQYTRDDLKNLYKDEKQKTRRDSINKIINHLIENIIKKAKEGMTTFVEHFPKNKFSDLQDDVVTKLSSIFPDSKITCEEKTVDYVVDVTIDWAI